MTEQDPARTLAEPAEARVERGHGASAHLDLGHEPPLSPSGQSAGEIDRRAVSLRWLAGSVLTGLSGALLIGAAIHISVEGDGIVAERPEAAAPQARTGPVVRAGARKADKLVQTQTTAVARQTFRSPMTIRVADREVIKVRPFVRIAANLSLTTGTYASDIPPFNPLRLFAEDGNAPDRYAEVPADVTDPEVSVVKRDLSLIDTAPDAAAPTDEEIAARLEEERQNAASGSRGAALPIPPQLLLSRSVRSPEPVGAALGYAGPIDTSFSAIEVRVVPENVTLVPKPEPSVREVAPEELVVPLRKGETLDTLLKAQGATPAEIGAIVAALGGRAKVNALPEGQGVRVLTVPGAQPLSRQVARVMLYGEKGIEAIAAMSDAGIFVPVAVPEVAPEQQDAELSGEDEDGQGGSGARLYESIYETGLRYELPRAAIEELIRVFSYDVDFQRRVSVGDTFEVFFADDEENSGRIEILYASLSVGGETRKVYRFVAPEDGSVDYFDEDGRSLKKFLLRKPIADGELRSTFGMRRHPVLGYSKMHTGIDWANKIGTPILAAGNGTVIKAEWDSGYGRRTEIQHPNGYVTAYSHQSAFAKGVAPGSKVRQGQVIGYVGNSGLSTGPHLHYEVLVNNRFVNPLKIKVPRSRELDGRALVEFRRQREQADNLILKSTTAARFAQRDGS